MAPPLILQHSFVSLEELESWELLYQNGNGSANRSVPFAGDSRQAAFAIHWLIMGLAGRRRQKKEGKQRLSATEPWETRQNQAWIGTIELILQRYWEAERSISGSFCALLWQLTMEMLWDAKKTRSKHNAFKQQATRSLTLWTHAFTFTLLCGQNSSAGRKRSTWEDWGHKSRTPNGLSINSGETLKRKSYKKPTCTLFCQAIYFAQFYL